MDANMIRQLQDQLNLERRKESQELAKRLEKEKAEAIQKGKKDGQGEVYQKVLAEIKKKVYDKHTTSLEYDFSEDDWNYLESLLKSLTAKLIKEGFKISRAPNILNHHVQGHYEMDYGHIDEHWYYTAKLEVSW